tara:strand:- start:2277 stop:5150 length:2874 start_codon:yes stop_codon:yes gene_type:complete
MADPLDLYRQRANLPTAAAAAAAARARVATPAEIAAAADKALLDEAISGLADIETRREERKKKAREANADRPSAPTQNNPELEPPEPTPEEQAAAEAAAAAKLKAQKAANQPGSPKSAFTNHLQSLLIERMQDAISVFSGDEPGSPNLHTIPSAPGPYISNFLPGGNDISKFLQATPAQLAQLQPLLRFYIVDNKGNQEEIYFADHVSVANIESLAAKRLAGDIQTSLPPKNKRGSNVGIRSFTWDYNNKHEGDKVIEASLQLYFGDMTELMNGNYLQFLFTTGLSAPSAADIGKKAGGGSRKIIKTDTEVQDELKTSIDKRKKALKTADGPDAAAKRFFKDKKSGAAAAKRDFRQLKVICGWSIPKGADTTPFGSPKDFESFKTGLRKTQRAIILNLIDYNVDFQQEGTATLSMKYVGSSDNYLASNSSDIFGSADPTKIATYFKKTDVSLTEAGAGKSKKTLFKLFEGTLKDEPYLSRLGGRSTNQGDSVLPVTLGGLQFAAQIANDERRLLEITNKDKEVLTGKPTPAMAAADERIKALVFLYKKALDLNLQELYNNFLAKIINSQNLKVGRVTIENGDNPDKATHKLRLAFGDKQVEDQQIVELLKKQTQAYNRGNEQRSSTEENKDASFDPGLTDPLAGDTKSITFHYMRLGDIIKAAMEQASFRTDVSLIMGNFRDGAGNVVSIYDIPITLGTFGQFFYNRIASRQLTTMPFDQFFRSLLKIVANVISQATKGADRLTFDFTTFNSMVSPKKGPLSKGAIRSIGAGAENPLIDLTQGNKKAVQAHTYYALFSRRTDHRNRLGIRSQDESEGIYHYTLASDRGLAKTFNFSRQDTKYFQEMLIESSNMESNIRALFLPQNVSIEMVGNGVHRNGDLIFVDSRAALGNWAGSKLGIGGYYRVVRCSHSISNRGYTTTLECVFELRAPVAARSKMQQLVAPAELIGLLDMLDEV